MKHVAEKYLQWKSFSEKIFSNCSFNHKRMLQILFSIATEIHFLIHFNYHIALKFFTTFLLNTRYKEQTKKFGQDIQSVAISCQ